MKQRHLLRFVLPVAILVCGLVAILVFRSITGSGTAVGAAPEVLTTEESMGTTISRTEVQVFQAAGDVGGGVLEPGTTFPPSKGSHAILRRGKDYVSYNVHTTGLPPGTYTNWWVFFNNPAGCIDGCGEDDLLRPEPEVSVLWSDGSVVQSNGVGNFHARISVGEVPSGEGQLILGQGLTDAKRAEVHIIIKYHGPPSGDPDVLHGQTHTLGGSCLEGANAVDLGEPFGVQCFDPQAVVFPGIE